MNVGIRLVSALAVAAVAGCAQPPAKGKVADITPEQAIATDNVGTQVAGAGPS